MYQTVLGADGDKPEDKKKSRKNTRPSEGSDGNIDCFLVLGFICLVNWFGNLAL